MNRFITLFYSFFILNGIITAQNPVLPTSFEVRKNSFDQRKKNQKNSIVANIPFKTVGPTIQSCRVTDIDVSPTDPTQFYVAYASGGLWKTENNGTSFTPLFDNEMVMTIGDIAVNWDKNIIWLGSGEHNSSRSSYSGAGIYKSLDGGKTWEHSGLGESHHIGRIILHPTNPDIVYVAVLGHLYSPNAERGVYKTIDGGKNWQKVLFIDDNTGAIDLIMDASNPDKLYTSTWQRERRAWTFSGSGVGSGIYKTTDAGNTWQKLNTPQSGFPIGSKVGRIGLAQYKDKILYAVLDNQNEAPPKDKKEDKKLTVKALRKMSKAEFLALEESKISDFLKDNDFPTEYTAKSIINHIKNDKFTVQTLIDYLEDANVALFDIDYIGAELYKSTDEGKTWQKTHQKPLDNLFFSYGYYFANVRVAPYDSTQVYILGVPIVKSTDGGNTFLQINTANVHADHHCLWINPNRKGHLINGNDGGINISYDYGNTWIKCNQPPVGQVYQVAVDMAKPYNIYAGFQDNGVWKGSSKSDISSVGWQQYGEYPYKEIIGGDGMQTAVDTTYNTTVYTGYQFGNYYRINTTTREDKYITPKHQLGERPHRWNWQTPVMISPHNNTIIYMAANRLLRSFDKGEHFTPISEDLTGGGRKGDIPYGTITAMHESPMKFGLIYCGSDDGKVNMTHDGGNTWININNGLPDNYYISRIQASAHQKGTVYVALNGYRWDDFGSYIYVSEDFGKNWAKIGTDLPIEPINVVKEDPKNQNIIYVGTDHGLYVSLDKGKNFHAFQKNFPAVAVHDVVIHPRESEIVVGTHGRTVQLASVKELQQLEDSILNKKLHIFTTAKRKAADWGKNINPYKIYQPPTLEIPIYAANDMENVIIKILTEDNQNLYEWNSNLSKGLNYIEYHYYIQEKNVADYEKALNAKSKDKAKAIKLEKGEDNQYYLKASKYKIIITHKSDKAEGKFDLE